MFEKNLNIAFLLDFYGEVLSRRTKDLLEMYYCDDMSLAEIADAVGITRQGARQAIKKGEEELLFLEEKLGLANRHTAVLHAAAELESLVSSYGEGADAEALRELRRSVSRLSAIVLDKDKE